VWLDVADNTADAGLFPSVKVYFKFCEFFENIELKTQGFAQVMKHLIKVRLDPGQTGDDNP
jgi:hypothetical protein